MMEMNEMIYYGGRPLNDLVDKDKYIQLVKLCGVDLRGRIAPVFHIQFKKSTISLFETGAFIDKCREIQNILGLSKLEHLPLMPADYLHTQEFGFDPELVTVTVLDLNPCLGKLQYCIFENQYCRIIEENAITGTYLLRAMGDIMRCIPQHLQVTDEQKVQAIMDATRGAPREFRFTKTSLRKLDSVDLNKVYRGYYPQPSSTDLVVAHDAIEEATWLNYIWGSNAHVNMPTEFVTLVEELDKMGLLKDQYGRPTKGFDWEEMGSDENYALST